MVLISLNIYHHLPHIKGYGTHFSKYLPPPVTHSFLKGYGTHFFKYLPPPVTHRFFLTPTTPDEVKTELNNLSEYIASDVPVKIIKMAFHPLGNMLSHIYNNSFGTGE